MAARLPRFLLVLVVLALLGTACGPRFDRDQVPSLAGVPAGTTGGPAAIDGATTDGGSPAPLGTAGSSPSAEGTDTGSSGDPFVGGDGGASGTDTTGTGGGTGDSGTTTDGGGDTTTTGGGTSSTTTGSSSTTTGTQATGPGNTQGVSDDTIRIGYLVPLTGAAPIPTSWDDGANLYWEWKNDNGGIHGRRVELLIEDTESSTTTAVQKARKLATQDKVHTILSLDRLEVQDAIARFLEQVGMPHLMIQSPANPPASWRNTFTFSVDHAVQGRAIADFWAADLQAANGAKKVAFVREQTNALKPGTDAFEARARELGLDVVARLTIDPSSPDVSQTVLALSDSGAQIVWLYMAPTPAARIIGQSGSQGYRPTWFANSISWGFELMHGVTGGFMEGAYAFSPWVSLSHPDTRTYKQAWQRYVGGTADDIGLVGWGAGGLVDAAMTSAGKQLGWDSLRSALRNLRIDTDVWVPIDLTGGSSLGTRSVAVYRAEGGAWKTVEPRRTF